VATSGAVDAGLTAQAVALGAALDRVRRTCIDPVPPLPRLDRDIADLARDVDEVISQVLRAAWRFLAADGGRQLWSGTGDLGDLGRRLLGIGNTAKSMIDVAGHVLGGPPSQLSAPASDWLFRALGHSSEARRVLGGLSRFSGTPVAGAAQSALITMMLFEDGNRLRRDGNPVNAWRRKGAGYITDVAGAGFDVSSTACASEPTWATCGAAGVTGAVWGGAEVWQHREGLVQGVDLTSSWLAGEARRLRDRADQALHATGAAQQRLIDTIRSPGLVRLPPVVTHAVADAVERSEHLASGAAHATGHIVSRGWHLLTP
jgi:hypothetical protein